MVQISMTLAGSRFPTVPISSWRNFVTPDLPTSVWSDSGASFGRTCTFGNIDFLQVYLTAHLSPRKPSVSYGFI